MEVNGVARTLKKLSTLKEDYWIKQRCSLIVSLFKMGASLEGMNMLTEGSNSFLQEQFFNIWKIAFYRISGLPSMLIFFKARA